jgi:hypothetical protein
VTFTFNASQVHFRSALDHARRARERQRESEAERLSGGSGAEPRAREMDAAIEAVILTQAAAEAYASWVHIQSGIHPGFLKWKKAWKDLPRAAAGLGRPDDFELGAERLAVLDRLSKWRDYLMHTDPDVRVRLRDALIERGEISATDDESAIISLLNADLAEWAVSQFESLFRWAEARTGIQAPFTQGAWPGEGFRRLSHAVPTPRTSEETRCRWIITAWLGRLINR